MIETTQKLYFGSSGDLSYLDSNSIDLIVTSPPYPMIEMWDGVFSGQDENIKLSLEKQDGNSAFNLMHNTLDAVWEESARILKDGGFACINIGDATRKIGDPFKLYSNHSRILMKFHDLGFDILPLILWRKQTNAPNKFMGSGMLPAGAYVTLEHEYILILRKGGKRVFKSGEEKLLRRGSAYFWEERNLWFSDVWDFKGIRQALTNGSTRKRSAAYPFELAYRLINMYSVKGGVVLDPFVGTGTTLLAAIASGRNGIGVDIDGDFYDAIKESIIDFRSEVNFIIQKRLTDHIDFIKQYIEKKGPAKYINKTHQFPVVTSQEVDLQIDFISEINFTRDFFTVNYENAGDSFLHAPPLTNQSIGM
ncbi:MAG: site-specific DNA-methyltransferase [Spirochaetales bacterium]|nr:site-specific DNA-methyltransferase [Spirochaetales bacterium]